MSTEGAAAVAPREFDRRAPWDLAQSVALRPETFGALAYDFRTRRLSFLKDPLLVQVLRGLGAHSSAEATCEWAGVPASRRGAFEQALSRLAVSGMIEPRE